LEMEIKEHIPKKLASRMLPVNIEAKSRISGCMFGVMICPSS
jgi:hypothetical protein